MVPADMPGRRQRFGLVLIFVTASFMVEGTLSGNGWAQVAVTALLGTTLLLTFWAADMPPRRLRVAAVVVAAVMVAGSRPSRSATTRPTASAGSRTLRWWPWRRPCSWSGCSGACAGTGP